MTLLLLALIGCGGTEAPRATTPTPPPSAGAAIEAKVGADAQAEAAQAVPAQHTNLFQPVSRIPVEPTARDLVELGRMLYYDTRLSAARDLSCNSCHLLDRYGADGEATSPGHEGQRGDRNSPTVYHAFGHVAQFWDGRAADVEEQAKGPILNPVEMAMPSEEAVVERLNGIPGYHAAFAKAFPGESEPITYDNLARAIGAFERHLVTPGRFDAYLAGDANALTPEERAGLDQFIATGCATCHSGPHLGGSMFMKLGLVRPYPTTDTGREQVTGNPADRHVFKVPSLRNIAETGPWFHDGSVTELDEAVRLMASHQLGKDLADDEVASISTFLRALTGEIDKAYIMVPQLPPDGPDDKDLRRGR